jgi:hypothetical protein
LSTCPSQVSVLRNLSNSSSLGIPDIYIKRFLKVGEASSKIVWLPCVVSIPGMDGYKERSVALSGDRFLSRGIAVLVVEGPGQYESAVLDIRVSVPAWQVAGSAMFDWEKERAETRANDADFLRIDFRTSCQPPGALPDIHMGDGTSPALPCLGSETRRARRDDQRAWRI